MASVNINFNLGLKELVSDDTLLSKAVACSDILEQKIVLSTMRLLNKKSKSGKTKTSGSLAQGWKSVIVSPPKSSKVIFGVTNPVVYADIHNWGKQGLKSSRGKMLAIPLSKEAQTRGAPSHWGKNEKTERTLRENHGAAPKGLRNRTAKNQSLKLNSCSGKALTSRLRIITTLLLELLWSR